MEHEIIDCMEFIIKAPVPKRLINAFGISTWYIYTINTRCIWNTISKKRYRDTAGILILERSINFFTLQRVYEEIYDL